MLAQEVISLPFESAEEKTSAGVDINQIRRDLYLRTGFHVIRGFLSADQVGQISRHWSNKSNKTVGRYVKQRMLYNQCPNVSHLTPTMDRHFNYFWNAPSHQFTYLNAWRLQSLRNEIEGNPVNQDFLPYFPKNRVDPDYYSASSFRIVTTRQGGAVKPHIDWPLDHSRIQFELMLSSYGEDYSGGLMLDDRFRGGRLVNLCKQQQLQAGDLLIFRYGQRHCVQAVESGPSGRGFSRMMMPLESIPVARKPIHRIGATAKRILRRIRNRLMPNPDTSMRSCSDEALFADGVRNYYDDDIQPLMDIAVENGFPPSEVFYHRGLWARFHMFADWQFDALIQQGLKPHHHFLDIGCGFMRLGLKLVLYLDDGRYCGVDPIQGYLDLADCYMQDIAHCNKRYDLLAGGDCAFDRFGRKFDYAMAHSVFTHMNFDQIRHCFGRLKDVMSDGGQFLFTVCLGDDREEDFIYVDDAPMTHSRHRDVSFYESLADEMGFNFQFLGRAGHPTQFVCKATFEN